MPETCSFSSLVLSYLYSIIGCASTHESRIPLRAEGKLDPLELGLQVIWASPCGCGEPNSGPLEEQNTAFLTTELSTDHKFFIDDQCMCGVQGYVSGGASAPLPSVHGLWGSNSGCETCGLEIFICSSFPLILLLFSSFLNNILLNIWEIHRMYFAHSQTPGSPRSPSPPCSPIFMLLLFWESPSPLSAIRVLDVCSSTGVWSTYGGSYPQRKLSVPSSLKATPSCCTLLISTLCGNSNWDINVYKFKSNIHKRGKGGDVCVSGSSLPFSAWLFTVLCIHLQTFLLRHHIKYQSLVYN